MRTETKESLLDSRSIRIAALTCHRSYCGESGEECKAEHQITIPLSGVNVKHVAKQVLVVNAARATLSNRGEIYRISHPCGSGETALNIGLDDDLLLDIVRQGDPAIEDRPNRPFSTYQVPIDASAHLAATLLASAARARTASSFELQEVTLRLVDRLLNG